MPPLALKKLFVACEFKPTLTAYGRMDAVAIGMTHEFPDWERSALTLELRDNVAHRALFMDFKSVKFQCDDPADHIASVRLAAELSDTALRKFEVNKLQKLLVNQLFIAPFAGSFNDLMFRIHNSFHRSFDSISAFDDCRLSDVAILISLAERGSKWHRTVQVGPMTRAEYLAKHPLELKLYNLQQAPIKDYVDAIPETLIFISIGTSCEGCDRQFAVKNAADAAARASLTADKLLALIEGTTNGQ